MRKNINSSIYHIGNCIRMQKINFTLKIRFSNDDPNSSVKKIKILLMIETKCDIRICCQDIRTVFPHRGGRGVNV